MDFGAAGRRITIRHARNLFLFLTYAAVLSMDGCFFRNCLARLAADVNRVVASPLLGFARPLDEGRFQILYWHPSGIGVHRLDAGDMPAWLRADATPQHAVRRLHARADRPIRITSIDGRDSRDRRDFLAYRGP